MRRVKLGEICEINIGKTPSRSEKSFWNGEFCWLSISDMKSKFLSQTKEKITDKAINSTNMKIVRKGTVVMSFKLSIGKVAILSEDMYTNEAIANFVIKNNYDILTDYLYYALQSLKFDHLGDRAVMGKTLNKAKLNNLSIVFYEPNEQRKIVDKLDVISNLIDYRQKQFKELSNLVKSRFHEMFGDPFLNEMGWEKLTIQKVLIGKPSNGYFVKRDDYIENGNVKILGVADIVNRMFSKTDNLPSTNVTSKDIEKYKVNYGDLLFCRSSLVAEGIGKASIVSKHTEENILFECHVIRLQLDLKKCIPEFIQMLTESHYFRNQILKHAKTSTMTTISQDGILKSEIILPPLALQNQFADFVAEVDKSQLAIKKSLEELETLKKSLMQAYFG